ncbi:MAG: FtsX-like permease family protein [Chitinophagales bacterium]|nr:ABC transporter permease [Chitinophagales bacterium]MDW8273842.1 FtsX-like permease family protein [Chitinophagales bacterium]
MKRLALSQKGSFTSFIIKMALGAVALSSATIIIATSLINGFQKEIREKIFGFWSHINIAPFSLTQSLEERAIYKYQDFYLRPEIFKQAKHIQATAYKAGLLKTRTSFDGIILKGAGADFYRENFNAYLKKGQFLSSDTSEAYQQIVISTATAKRLNLDIGDKVSVHFMGKSHKARPFKVCGIYETGMEEFDRQFAITSLAVLQDLNGWGRDSVGSFEIYLDGNNLSRSRISDYLLTLFGGLLPEQLYNQLQAEPIDRIAEDFYYIIYTRGLDVQTIKSLNPGIFDWLGLQTMNEIIILFLMAVVAVMNVITALLILILEHIPSIGIWKAMGSDNSSIRKIFIYYGIIITAGGIVLGNVVGISLCLIQKKFGLITLPQESYYLSKAPIALKPLWILAINAFTVIICSIFLLFPVRIIKNINPVTAIRFR